MANQIMAPISVGELYDKISILEIKRERIEDAAKMKNISFELELLNTIASALPSPNGDIAMFRDKLKEVNGRIWDLEERVRALGVAKNYGEEFISVARLIHEMNDTRASIKKVLNVKSNSEVVEEKSYSLPKN
ncbi:MAG: hypothetical protein JO001_19130 [Alphaproteobacteria bacterium]|nr:hypothetical protein [Alphaproteobacteria bacterium]